MVVVKNIILPIKPNNIKEFNSFRKEPFKTYVYLFRALSKGKD